MISDFLSPSQLHSSLVPFKETFGSARARLNERTTHGIFSATTRPAANRPATNSPVTPSDFLRYLI